MNKKLCIGLFGTCGQSTWRKPFIEKYVAAGLDYFNPQVAEWTPACAAAESHHLAHDEILIYPILGETYGIASLAESGYAVAQSLQPGKDKARHVLFYIEPKVSSTLREKNSFLADESDRARTLVRAHLERLNLPSVHSCQSLDEMLSLSLQLTKGY